MPGCFSTRENFQQQKLMEAPSRLRQWELCSYDDGPNMEHVE